ncbi:MAG: helix-turn-helix domain-containing protein [Armatimonadetes bacterium]|jgi:excisionase family DNA binding protein|nr:helix-turn-helix domain-containing protein [Armatimonadota bacterium]
MANYDSKLGEWFKELEQQEQELKARRTPSKPEQKKYHKEPDTPKQPIERMQIETTASDAPVSLVATVESDEVVVESSPQTNSLAVDSDEIAESGTGRVSADSDAPPVEDFFEFLSRSSKQSVEEIDEPTIEPDSEMSAQQTTIGLTEGTGEPRPLPKTEPPAEPIVRVPSPTPGKAVEVKQEAKPVTTPKPKPAAKTEPASAQTNWDRVPHHLQTLFGSVGDEVAQNSYKAFKETREELVQRLLDPTISLEEAARILNVCPTTVRRYTNRGVLKHYRTAGNQRRFKLSDVLAFMEDGKPSVPKSEPAE